MGMGMRMGKRMWAVLLAVCLLAGFFRVSAEEAGTGGEPEASPLRAWPWSRERTPPGWA